MSTAGTLFCSECGRAVAADDLLQFGDRRVCADCKPAFAQRLRQEGIAPIAERGLEYGGFWIRFAARLIDGVILGVVVLALDAGFSLLLRPSISSRGPSSFSLIQTLVLPVNLALGWIYEVLFLVRNGATPGKMALNLQVINVTGRPISWGKATARFFCHYLDQLTLTIGYLIAAFDSEKRALHDHICGTRVVRQAVAPSIIQTRI